MSRLAELKKRVKAQATSKKGKFDSNYYRFFDMPYGSEAVVRLLGDKDKENPDMIYVEKFRHTLNVDGENKQITCLKTYGEKCPICERADKYYKAGDKVKGKYYLKNQSYLFTAVVLQDPLPLNPEIGSYKGKKVVIDATYQVKERILGALQDFKDDESEPWDLNNGCNFVIRKNEKKGDNGKVYADYTQSSYERRSSALAAEYQEGLELTDLKTLLPKKPTLEEVSAFLEAHDKGQALEETLEKALSAKKEANSNSEDWVKEETPAEVSQQSSQEDESEESAESLVAKLRRQRAEANKNS